MEAKGIQRLLGSVIFSVAAYCLQAQVFADSQFSGTTGPCSGCAVLDPEAAVDADYENNYAVLMVDPVSGACTYEDLLFSAVSSGGEYVSVVIGSTTPMALDQDKLAGVQLCTSRNGVSNGDTIRSTEFSIVPLNGTSTRYALEFISAAPFDRLQLAIHGGVDGAIQDVKLYYGYYANSPLPITLTDLKATREAGDVILTWKTLAEINNKSFAIQRSGDGQQYETIGQVAGAGNSTLERSYRFTDNEPPDGQTYYRIRQIDNNGSSQYFPAVLVDEVVLEDNFEVFPNPAGSSDLRIRVRSELDFTVSVVNVAGKQVYAAQVPGQSRLTELTVSAELESGIYLIYVVSEQSVKTKRIVIN